MAGEYRALLSMTEAISGKDSPSSLPSPLTGEGESGGERVAQGMERCPRLPPIPPFPATASAEGRQFNGAPSPARGEGEQKG